MYDVSKTKCETKVESEWVVQGDKVVAQHYKKVQFLEIIHKKFINIININPIL